MNKKYIILILCIFILWDCKKEEKISEKKAELKKNSIGVGPVKKVVLDADINSKMVKNGKTVFAEKCSSCHKINERYVGPALKGVTKRRKPEWIMNMILNPEKMLDKDPVAGELLVEYMTKMVSQGLNRKEARDVLEYFRKVDSKN